MLSADARYGTAAWDWPSRAKLLDSGAVESRWSADKDHPFDMTARYRFSAPDTLDLTVTVVPRQNLRRFELFLSSYFWGFSTSFAYVRNAGVAGALASRVSSKPFALPASGRCFRATRRRWK